MLKRSEGDKQLSKKDLINKINYQLTGNFFSLEELKELSLFQVKKVIKLISKINKIKLTRREIKEIAIYLKSDLSQENTSAQKLWSFVKRYQTKTKEIVKNIFIWWVIWVPNNYRSDRFELMRN